MRSCQAMVMVAFVVVSASESPASDPPRIAPGLTRVDAETIAGPKHFVDGYPSVNSDGTVNVVVEIPAGTNQKWEVAKDSGALTWTHLDGAPRNVAYLAYPANYGMIPRTLLPEDRGGDGDPLDVVVLGPALPRGAVVPARIVGVLRLVDRGEQDDKLLAVPLRSPYDQIADLRELDDRLPGATSILETWFTNYKGKDVARCEGFASREKALTILKTAMVSYARDHGRQPTSETPATCCP
ncbi:Inorganic pyrophosphatase [Planctomycetes bacterium Pan216]|uniref:inorganic diphosphatase n=1 Tax=Kolteria novifilia TaxID=2527975 RepID=A0A518BBJ7_9BACT|nr:Inorganic pyrophosphatase [Planctomycetes bacterium Pan216]